MNRSGNLQTELIYLFLVSVTTSSRRRMITEVAGGGRTADGGRNDDRGSRLCNYKMTDACWGGQLVVVVVGKGGCKVAQPGFERITLNL